MIRDLTIAHVATTDEARSHLAQGFCTIECSFGAESVVDELRMNHHGEFSTFEPVSLRAYRDHSGSRRTYPRFVVTSTADADAALAIAALADMLLAQGRDREAVPLLDPARAIADADLNPFAQRSEESDTCLLLLCYKQRMKAAKHDAAAFYAEVECRRELITNPPRFLLATVSSEDAARVALARKAELLRLIPEVAIVECPVWGWDVWYTEVSPVIVAYERESGRCNIGCRDHATAQRLFGLNGLLAIVEHLKPQGSGGRPTISDSPRAVALERMSVLDAAQATLTNLAQPPRLNFFS